jgi:hypothetical protein
MLGETGILVLVRFASAALSPGFGGAAALRGGSPSTPAVFGRSTSGRLSSIFEWRFHVSGDFPLAEDPSSSVSMFGQALLPLAGLAPGWMTNKKKPGAPLRKAARFFRFCAFGQAALTLTESVLRASGGWSIACDRGVEKFTQISSRGDGSHTVSLVAASVAAPRMAVEDGYVVDEGPGWRTLTAALARLIGKFGARSLNF